LAENSKAPDAANVEGRKVIRCDQTTAPFNPPSQTSQTGWRVTSVEPLGKRAIAACLSCGLVREVNAIALRAGEVSCGCAGSRPPPTAPTFARDPVVFVVESGAAQKFRIAKSLEEIADEIEAENGP
jgi:hypothetical protein